MTTKRRSKKPVAPPPGIPVDTSAEPIDMAPHLEAGDVVEVKRVAVTVSIPYIEGLNGYAARRVDMTLTAGQAELLRGVLQALNDRNARLESGQAITRPVHAIQWMIEQVKG